MGFEGMFERGTGRGCSSGKQGVGFTLGIDKCSARSAAPAAPTNAVPALGGGFCWLPDPGRVCPTVEVTVG